MKTGFYFINSPKTRLTILPDTTPGMDRIPERSEWFRTEEEAKEAMMQAVSDEFEMDRMRFLDF